MNLWTVYAICRICLDLNSMSQSPKGQIFVPIAVAIGMAVWCVLLGAISRCHVLLSAGTGCHCWVGAMGAIKLLGGGYGCGCHDEAP